MAKLENYRPILKSGRIVPKGGRLVYETEEPYREAILPIENVDFLLLCTGEYTVGEIIENIYHRKGNVQFKLIYKTLIHLKERDLLHNGDDLEVPKSINAIHNLNFLALRPLWDTTIGNRIFSEREHPALFYLCSMAITISAILCFQFFNYDWFHLGFLKFSGTFFSGIAFTFIVGSILLSLKAFLKCLLLLFLTGRAYNFGIAFNGLFIYFRTQSDSLFLVTNRLYLLIYHFAVILCYFPIIGLAYFLFPNLPYQSDVFSLGFILLLFDLHPFQESELTYFIRSLFNDDTVNKLSTYLKHNPLFSLIHPFERGKDYNLYFFYTHLTLLWSVAALYTFKSTVDYHNVSLLETLKAGEFTERMAAAFITIVGLTLSLLVIINLFRILYLSLWTPTSQIILNYARHRNSRRLDMFNKKDIAPVLDKLPLFSYFNNELLNMIIHRSELNEYKAKSPVIVQGDEGRHMFVLLSGQLLVRQRLPSGQVRNISQILPPSIFGEIAVIEETKRMADVIAIKDSIILVVPARMLRQVAEESHYIRELVDFKNAIMVNQYFSSAPIFRDLPENIIQMFISKGMIENFEADQVVFSQGELGDGFYLLLRGSVGVNVNGRPVSRIQQGGFFGEISMIADVPRTATIHALEKCQVLKVNRTAFWEILSQDINMAMFIESIGEMRIREDIEILNGTQKNNVA